VITRPATRACLDVGDSFFRHETEKRMTRVCFKSFCRKSVSIILSEGIKVSVLGYLQKIGRALMVPVAVLPAAAIMMGVGIA